MMTITANEEVSELRRRLEDAEETLRAIRCDEVDALVVDSAAGERVFTLNGADHAYRVLIDAMQQGAATISDEGVVLYCNRAFAAFFSQSQWDITGRPLIEFLPPSQQQPFHELLLQSRLACGNGELLLEGGDGGIRTIQAALTPLSMMDVSAICVVLTDTTEQKQHRDLQDSNRRKDEFLAMLAHELRNPLAPILNAVAILNHLMRGDDKLAYVSDIIERQTRHLSRLVDDLLDVSRISLGKVKLQKERIELATVIARAAEISTPLINARQHQLTIQMPPKNLMLEADATRLAQVISNLLTNAAKYTDQGGLIHLSAELDGNDAVISVRDTGIGIPADLLPRVFDLFTQGDRSLARSEGGLGIGLTLVRRLVELHGGSVKAVSAGIGCGSEFTVRLPAIPMEKPVEASPPMSPNMDSGCHHVLIVDDNKDAADTIGMLINLLGHKVAICNSSEEALQKAQAMHFQAAFLDIGLPGMNGQELASRLRAVPGYSETMLVAMTGYGQEEDVARSRQAGFNHHCVKPVELTLLNSLLQSLKSSG